MNDIDLLRELGDEAPPPGRSAVERLRARLHEHIEQPDVHPLRWSALPWPRFVPARNQRIALVAAPTAAAGLIAAIVLMAAPATVPPRTLLAPAPLGSGGASEPRSPLAPAPTGSSASSLIVSGSSGATGSSLSREGPTGGVPSAMPTAPTPSDLSVTRHCRRYSRVTSRAGPINSKAIAPARAVSAACR